MTRRLRIRTLMIIVALAALACAVMFVGRVEYRLDATNEQTLRASCQQMTVGMSRERRQELAEALLVIANTDGMKDVDSALSRGETFESNPMAAMKPMHGMTADQIIARAEQIRDESDE